MKSKHQEYIRTIEFLGGIIATVAANKCANIDIQNIAMLPFLADTLLSQRTATFTKDYKEVKEMYDKVITNFSKLMKDFNIEDVVEIFAIYVYMYRKGYLSYGHSFEYNTKMKDLPKLMGVDVIRGSGVCRSIASMLSDIYNKMAIESDTLVVSASKDSIASLEKISIAHLNKNIKGKKFAKVIGNMTQNTNFPNHLITAARKDSKTYILDPTNDGILYNRGNAFYPYDDIVNSMKYNKLMTVFQKLLGMIDNGNLKNIINSESINQEEYHDKYIKAINFIIHNIDYFDSFYHNNFSIYKDIYTASNGINSYIKRIVPIIKK